MKKKHINEPGLSSSERTLIDLDNKLACILSKVSTQGCALVDTLQYLSGSYVSVEDKCVPPPEGIIESIKMRVDSISEAVDFNAELLKTLTLSL